MLRLASLGHTERSAARVLGIAPATVRGHLMRARERLGASSTCHAVALAIRMGAI